MHEMKTERNESFQLAEKTTLFNICVVDLMVAAILFVHTTPHTISLQQGRTDITYFKVLYYSCPLKAVQTI